MRGSNIDTGLLMGSDNVRFYKTMPGQDGTMNTVLSEWYLETSVSYTLAISTLVLSSTWNNIGLRKGYLLSVGTLAIALTGNTIGLVVGRAIQVATLALTLGMVDITLTASSGTPPPVQTIGRQRSWVQFFWRRKPRRSKWIRI